MVIVTAQHHCETIFWPTLMCVFMVLCQENSLGGCFSGSLRCVPRLLDVALMWTGWIGAMARTRSTRDHDDDGSHSTPAPSPPLPVDDGDSPDPRFPERPRAGGGAASRGSRRRERAKQGAGGPETKPPPGTTKRTPLARPLTHAFTCPLCLQTGATALKMAAQFGHAPVVDMLLQAGADKELPDTVGWTGTESRP